jgi:hypothetical protein
MPGRASSPVKKVFGPPFMGVMNTLPEHELPPNALWAAYNVMFLGGRALTRWSMVPLSLLTGASNPSFATRPLSCFSTRTSARDFDVYVSTHTKLHRLRNLTGSWTDVTGAVVLTNGNSHTPRWAALYDQASAKTQAVMVNGVDNPVSSLDGANFIQAAIVGNDKPIDITTAASRFVMIVPPYRVRWSDIYSGIVPAANFYTAQDTTGEVVAIRNLGTLGVCIYKEDAIIVGYSQPGSPANAFRFENRIELPGPAGPSAVVQAEGKHFWMTARGRIGMFDGTRYEWVGDGIWNFLFGDFDFNNRAQTHGWYEEALGQVWFVYPRVPEVGAGPTGIAIITLPRPAWGIPSYGVWPGAFALPVSSSNTMRHVSGYKGLLMRSDAGNFNAEIIGDPAAFAKFGDDNTRFSCLIHTGLQGLGEITAVELEPFLTRGADRGTCDLSALISYHLATDGGGIVLPAQAIDLENVDVIHDVKGFRAAGRFVGLKLSWQCRLIEALSGAEEGGAVNYKGCAMYGYGVETP